MNYWKGLLVAAVFDAAWVGVHPFLAPEPARPAAAAVNSDSLARADLADRADLAEVDRRVDSLMGHLQRNPADVGAMLTLARLYADRGWHEAAIGPLARALQLDAFRRGSWVALDRAVERSGRGTITDAELARAALHFVEAVEMWGHGC